MSAADLAVPETDPGEARDAIERILARDEFDDGETWLTRARDWVLERLGDAFETLFGGDGGGTLAWVVAAALTAGAVFFAVRFTRGLRRDPGTAPTVPAPRRRPAVDWRADAEANERAGDWRAALRCRYRALVADLAARGLVEEVPGRTAGEYREEVRANVPGAAPDFAGATSLFEDAWYGNRPTGPDESARFRQLEARVLTGAGR